MDNDEGRPVRQSAALLLALSSCATTSPVSRETVTFACGVYRYEFGDLLQLKDGNLSPDNSILIVRDQASQELLLALNDGDQMRFATIVIDPCNHPKGNMAACLQGGDAAIVLLRPMTRGEACTSPEILLRKRSGTKEG